MAVYNSVVSSQEHTSAPATREDARNGATLRRILVVSAFRRDVLGGAAKHTDELMRRLRLRGHHVEHSLYPHLYQTLKRSSGRPGNATHSRFNIRPDVVVVAKGGIGNGSLRSELAVRLRGRRLITIEHSTVTELPPMRRMWRLPAPGIWRTFYFLRYYARSWAPDRIICVSHISATRLMSQFRFPPRKMSVIHNGVDAATFLPSFYAAQAVRSRFGIPPNAVVFGTLASFMPVKRLDLAIRGFGEAVRSVPQVEMRMLVVGDGPERRRLEEVVKQRDLHDYVIFTGATAEPQAILPGIEFFLLTSETEGMPLALLEAMSCGCVPIAVPVGGVPEIVLHGECGWLVSASEASLAEAIRAAARTDQSQRIQMSRQAREHIQQAFDEGRQFDLLCHTIERVGNSENV